MEVAGVRRPRRQWLSNSGYKNAMQCIYPAVAADRMDREGAWGHDGLWPFIYNQLLDIGSQSMRLETLDSGLPRTRRGLGNSWVLATTCFLKMTTTPPPQPPAHGSRPGRPQAAAAAAGRTRRAGYLLFAATIKQMAQQPTTCQMAQHTPGHRAPSKWHMWTADARREPIGIELAPRENALRPPCARSALHLRLREWTHMAPRMEAACQAHSHCTHAPTWR
jgi:hypothetical protein